MKAKAKQLMGTSQAPAVSEQMPPPHAIPTVRIIYFSSL